jgi:hypothetical protein
MSQNPEKRYIPGTNPEWGQELPEGMANSLVNKYGNNREDGYNFDERDEKEQEAGPKEETTYDNLKSKVKFDPEAAKKAREASQTEEKA